MKTCCVQLPQPTGKPLNRLFGHDSNPENPISPPKKTFIARVLEGQSVEKPVFEDDHMAVLMNIDPARSGHALVVSKRPVQYLAELNPQELLSLGKLTQLYQKFWRTRPANQGKLFNFVVFINDGPIAGQSVPHFHKQIVPIEASHPIPKGELRHLLSINSQNGKGVQVSKAFLQRQLNPVYGWLNQQVASIHQFAKDHRVTSSYSAVR